MTREQVNATLRLGGHVWCHLKRGTIKRQGKRLVTVMECHHVKLTLHPTGTVDARFTNGIYALRVPDLEHLFSCSVHHFTLKRSTKKACKQ